MPTRQYHRLLSFRLVLSQQPVCFLDFGGCKSTQRSPLVQPAGNFHLDSIEESKPGQRLHIPLREPVNASHTLVTDKWLTPVGKPTCVKFGGSSAKSVIEVPSDHVIRIVNNDGAYYRGGPTSL